MPRASSNGIEIEYETFGSATAPPLVLVMGLGGQMLLWDEEFCGALSDRGFHVVRFDNRDVGLTTKIAGAGMPNVLAAFANGMQGKPVEAAYTLDDMADDTAGLLDALGLADAHVAGASMGGMIAQTLAIRHPKRLRSMTSIMSTTGDRTLPPSKPSVIGVLTTPQPTERAAHIDHAVETWRAIGSPGFPFDEAFIRARAERLYDRAFFPEGIARQLVAILASGSRRAQLASVQAPTLVIHGIDDPLVPIEGGRDTAAAIPGAELVEIAGMGHDMPKALWPRLVELISTHAQRAERARTA